VAVVGAGAGDAGLVETGAVVPRVRHVGAAVVVVVVAVAAGVSRSR
jgi:hypothetical protein